MSRQDLYVAIFAAALAFVGALLGTYVGSRLDQANWEARYYVEARNSILERRIVLIERITNVLNKRALVEVLRTRVAAESKLTDIAQSCVRASAKRDQGQCVEILGPNLAAGQDAVREVLELNAEFTSAMSLANIYFGPRTRTAISELNVKGPWDSTDEQRQALLNALGAELNFFPANAP